MQNADLAERINDIRQIFSLESILGRDAEKPSLVAKYYNRNRLAYALFNSRKGFVHMGISRDGIFKPADFYEQGKIVKEYIEQTEAKQILELAPGKAATTEFLADSLPDTMFFGLDLPDGQLDIDRYKGKSNLKLSTGDFHDLSRYAADSMDVVYVIEALCHAADRQQVITEVQRVLKPGGFFIVFDGYYTKPEDQLSGDEKLASHLLFKSMMVTANNHYYPDFIQDAETSQLRLIKEEDLTQAIMPSLLRLETHARRFMKRPALARMMKRILPDEMLGNAIAGYLFPATVKAGIFSYHLSVFQKYIPERNCS